jgi:uncharacterized RDD family membrane protein YckC
MSDVSQGPGWWQASDGKWYPPESAPGGQAAAPQPQGFGAPVGAPSGTPVGPGGQPLADWGSRVVAYLIDYAIVLVFVIVGFIISAIFGAISTTLGVLLGLIVYIAAACSGLYFAFLGGATGQSPGKAITGLKIVGEETGQPIGGGMGIVRAIAHFVDAIICYIGFLFPLWDPKRQTIADKLMHTVVLSGLPKRQMNAEIFKA